MGWDKIEPKTGPKKAHPSQFRPKRGDFAHFRGKQAEVSEIEQWTVVAY